MKWAMKTTTAVGDESISHSRLADALIGVWTLPEIGYQLVVLQQLLPLHQRYRHHPDWHMLRYYEIRNEKLTMLNENGCMKLMGVHAIGMATQPTAFSAFSLLEKGIFWTLIFESESCIKMN
jgi:hypothetical protein